MFPRNSCLLSIITLLCTLNIVSLRLVGLRTWIQKLDENELKEIDNACRPNSKLTVKKSIAASGPENRIIDGNLALVGKYPFVGVFTNPNDAKTLRTTKCGGTFITPRHMLKARHCFSGNNETYTLLAGGVCHSEDTGDNCPNMDMVELDYELVIFDSWADDTTFGDIAILQMTESVTKKFPGEVTFACLPSSLDKESPMAITLLGWGRHESDQFSSHLREAKLPVMPGKEKYFLLAEANNPTPDHGVDRGDSGSGGVHIDHRLPNKYELWVVIIAKRFQEGIPYRRSVMLKTSYFLDDLCLYIGLCSPVQGFQNVIGLQPRLNFNGIYFPRGQRSGIGKSVEPFKQISIESSLYIKHKCDDFRNIGLNTENPCELSPTGWSMVIINTENTTLCDAVAVTDQHVITSRECIVPNLRKYHSGKVLKLNIFVRKRNCSGSDECVSWTINFISWAFSHPMAIVQLVESSKILNSAPACFVSSKENRMDMSEGLRGYGTVAKLVDNRYQICHQNDFFCAKSGKKCDQEPLSATPTSGYGIMDVGSRTLAGIKISELSQDNSIDVYWRTDNLIATLCIYPGRCDDESYSFLTKVAFLNNIYFMNVNP